MKGTID